MDNLFAIATRTKIRFTTSKGEITTEDLWTLSLESLDSLAVGIDKKLKDSSGQSFIGKKTNANTMLETQLELLKYVINIKMTEAETRRDKMTKLEEVNTLRDLLGKKKLQGMESMSSEEIEKRIKELEG